jgi:hypothetical protein
MAADLALDFIDGLPDFTAYLREEAGNLRHALGAEEEYDQKKNDDEFLNAHGNYSLKFKA